MASWSNELGIRKKLSTKGGSVDYYSLQELAQKHNEINSLPFSIKVLLEAACRQIDNFTINEKDVHNIIFYDPKNIKDQEIPFKPARVLMQDFTGVPGVVDLAAMRHAILQMKGDAGKINPVLPVDMVIDHSVQVDESGKASSLQVNVTKEFDRNKERYEFLKWGSQAFSNFRVVPPATGIVHQVNLEYLARVVQTRELDGTTYAFPDSLVGTDSHTTMINGLGVLGWGVGGIEAEAVMLDQPIYMLTPEVVGFKLQGELPLGATATDLVLTITEKLRKFGVVAKFVEFFGPGLKSLPLADRATIANMAPEYGATMGFFPIDHETIKYLENTGRDSDLIDLVERYAKEQGLFAEGDENLRYSDVLELDMSQVEPSLAGPKRPQDRINLSQSKKSFEDALSGVFHKNDSTQKVNVKLEEGASDLEDGSVVIAAITSCTNTSNPSVMLGAGLLAKKAVEKGLKKAVHVKTSLAPGSRVVTGYLKAAGLTESLNELGFHTVGYGCTTCIGNSGPIPTEISKAVQENDLVLTSVLSGNRNFEGRIHQDVKANYLASPPLVVAYSIAGNMNHDFSSEPIGEDDQGTPVYLKDIWPSAEEIKDTYHKAVTSDLFQKEYGNVFSGSESWNEIKSAQGDNYSWDENSTYIRRPTFFDGMTLATEPIQPMNEMRVIALLGDSVTTDHISPAGAIKKDSPAGSWLIEHGVEPKDFNTYGSRRGNHEIMMRGTFANIRIKNQLVPGVEGGYTVHIPSKEQMSIYDAAVKYHEEKTPLIVVAGKEYGTGSSRDWAAKGTMLLGIKAVLAESFERIHRSNLIGMGVLPLQFKSGESAASHGITGKEIFALPELNDELKPGSEIKLIFHTEDGNEKSIEVQSRLDTPVEVEYYRNGGILHTVLRKLGG